MWYFTGIVLTSFLVLILITKKGKSRADLLLVSWLVLTGFHLVLFYLLDTGNSGRFPWLLGFEIPLPLVHGPMLYLYITSCVKPAADRKKSGVIHFLLPLTIYLFLVPFFALPSEEKLEVYRNAGAGYETLMQFLGTTIPASGVTYVVLSLVRLARYRRNFGPVFPEAEKTRFIWLGYLVAGMFGVWLVVLYGNDKHIFVAVVLFVLGIGYTGIRQTGIFTGFPLAAPGPAAAVPYPGRDFRENDPVFFEKQEVVTEAEETGGKEKYVRSGLSDEMAGILWKDLHELMEKERLFTNPELTLSELSGRINGQPNHISQVINSKGQRSFNDFINVLRVQEFKQQVARPENRHYTLLAIAYSCGFNSKTSFNRNFRKLTGMSPSEYLEQEAIELR